MTLDTLTYSLCLAFPASVQQGKALKTQPRCAQQPNYAVPCLPEALELGTPCYNGQNVGSNDVRYREVQLYCKWLYKSNTPGTRRNVSDTYVCCVTSVSGSWHVQNKPRSEHQSNIWCLPTGKAFNYIQKH